MHKHGKRKKAGASYEEIALIGNPNVGKSVIFGLLTGKYVAVSNYPGTTVEVTYGNITLGERKFTVVDTPGVNSLLPMSEDERVSRDILLERRPLVVLQVGDSKNLKRTLLLTIQLAEMGLPVVLALNMEDEAMDRGITVDVEKLREELGIVVISTVAPQRKGIRLLREALKQESHAVPTIGIKYDPIVEHYIEEVLPLLPEAPISARSLATMLLAGDASLAPWLKANLDEEKIIELEALCDECRLKLHKSVGMSISESRIKLADAVAGGVVSNVQTHRGGWAPVLGRLSMHPLYGIPFFLLVVFALYEFVGVFGAGTLVDFLEAVLFGEYLNPMFTKVVETFVPFKILQEALVGEYGMITMAITYAIGIIFPITTTFFIAFSILEDSGYLPRLAIMSNRIFNVVGLSGKAVLPMVLGLGCGTMAVMTTRILETTRDRIIATFLLALAVPCAAQLGVILGMLGSLSGLAMVIWIGTMVLVILFTGFLASKIVRGEKSEFFLEIPPIRVPSIKNVAMKTQSRVVWYLKEAVPLFILGTFALFVLDKLALLVVIENFASPVVVGVLGLPEKATEAFLIGFFRRDYGAAGLFALSQKGLLDPIQTLVSLVTITLFVPCIAHFLMMIKEMGLRLSFTMLAIIIPLAISFGGLLNWVLRGLDVQL